MGEDTWVPWAAVGWKSGAFGCGAEQGVGSSSRVRFPWAGEGEQGTAGSALCVSAPCVHRNVDKGSVFLSVFDLSGHLSFSLTVCLSASVGNTTSWIWRHGTVRALCLSGREMKTHPGSWELPRFGYSDALWVFCQCLYNFIFSQKQVYMCSYILVKEVKQHLV